jgi:hypothetical protein
MEKIQYGQYSLMSILWFVLKKKGGFQQFKGAFG